MSNNNNSKSKGIELVLTLTIFTSVLSCSIFGTEGTFSSQTMRNQVSRSVIGLVVSRKVRKIEL